MLYTDLQLSTALGKASCENALNSSTWHVDKAMVKGSASAPASSKAQGKAQRKKGMLRDI